MPITQQDIEAALSDDRVFSSKIDPWDLPVIVRQFPQFKDALFDKIWNVKNFFRLKDEFRMALEAYPDRAEVIYQKILDLDRLDILNELKTSFPPHIIAEIEIKREEEKIKIQKEMEARETEQLQRKISRLPIWNPDENCTNDSDGVFVVRCSMKDMVDLAMRQKRGEDCSLEYANTKIHISIAQTDYLRSQEILMPILLRYLGDPLSRFKHVDLDLLLSQSDADERTVNEKTRLLNGDQYTLYFPYNSSISHDRVLLMCREIENVLSQNGISPGRHAQAEQPITNFLSVKLERMQGTYFDPTLFGAGNPDVASRYREALHQDPLCQFLSQNMQNAHPSKQDIV